MNKKQKKKEKHQIFNSCENSIALVSDLPSSSCCACFMPACLLCTHLYETMTDRRRREETQHKWVNNMAVCLNIFVHYYFVRSHIIITTCAKNLFLCANISSMHVFWFYLNETGTKTFYKQKSNQNGLKRLFYSFLLLLRCILIQIPKSLRQSSNETKQMLHWTLFYVSFHIWGTCEMQKKIPNVLYVFII